MLVWYYYVKPLHVCAYVQVSVCKKVRHIFFPGKSLPDRNATPELWRREFRSCSGIFRISFSEVASLNIRTSCDKWVLSRLVDVSITNPMLEYSLPHYRGMKIDWFLPIRIRLSYQYNNNFEDDTLTNFSITYKNIYRWQIDFLDAALFAFPFVSSNRFPEVLKANHGRVYSKWFCQIRKKLLKVSKLILLARPDIFWSEVFLYSAKNFTFAQQQA